MRRSRRDWNAERSAANGPKVSQADSDVVSQTGNPVGNFIIVLKRTERRVKWANDKS